ncbi:phenylacetic acid degradation operon negative regulatory protein PaaX [Tumebacillus sp. ITR2]|uniref:Phenylacetic acid degradation operon negative regulatory protein PaaX n=1 Tax=Tumebacillus amylolyticus TaxID=2801339 RepID=A0ABS1J8D0_9BACL|nr:phenylacetic acid degradation operon negative regulatory protein PaaX [Tumebacillus amylolyticus]MBL0386536.1 phenylacetic acid degradation operon negative regulatory protein PaaX [Tumebacillus amylolyticus]
MKPQSMLFTIYGEYLRHTSNEIWIGSLTRLLGEFGMTEQAVRAAISRMQRQGWLTSRKVGNRSFYSMSPRGQKRLDEAAERIYPRHEGKGWQGKWCMISYNIPEDRRHLRDQFRKELTYLGFGLLTNSTWFSPNDLTDKVREITETYEITGHVEIFTAEHFGWSEPRQLVEKCWDLESINASYRSFIDTYRPHFEALRAQGDLPDNRCFVEKTQLVHQYRKFLFIDPDLPQELLPDLWLGQEADELFSEFYGWLHPGATRFFEELYEAAP